MRIGDLLGILLLLVLVFVYRSHRTRFISTYKTVAYALIGAFVIGTIGDFLIVLFGIDLSLNFSPFVMAWIPPAIGAVIGGILSRYGSGK